MAHEFGSGPEAAGGGCLLIPPLSGDKQTSGERAKMTAHAKGFGCRPLEGRGVVFGGRRPKPSKGGNRA